jgi:type IV pilus assembly protein PilC
MNYQYNAYKVDRVVTSGMVEAVSEKMAEEALYRAGFKYVLKLKVKPVKKTLSQMIPSLYGVKSRDIIDFSRQLASFLDAGSSLRVALDLIKDQASKPALKIVITNMISRLEQGIAFSQVIKEYPEAFPFSYYQVIQSCEKAGDLVQGLNQIAEYIEQRAIISDKIKRALAYPAFVVCLAAGVIVLMVTTVLPPILKLFASFQTELPKVTVFALGLLNFFLDNKIALLIAVIVVASCFWLLSRFPAGKLLLDQGLLKVPLLGPLIIENSMGHFCRTASMLMMAGLPLPGIMDVAIKSVSRNQVLQKSFIKLKSRLMQGDGLALPVSQDKIFPSMMVRMISVGEQTGTLDSSLLTLAKYYEDHSNRRIQSLIGLIEPAMTVGIGVGIAFLMLSMIVPIYSIVGKVH